MTYKIEVDVTSAVRDFFPALTVSEVDLLAKRVSENWDYSSMYQDVFDNLVDYATYNNIDLAGKDGVEEVWLYPLFVINLLQDTLEQERMGS